MKKKTNQALSNVKNATGSSPDLQLPFLQITTNKRQSTYFNSSHCRLSAPQRASSVWNTVNTNYIQLSFSLQSSHMFKQSVSNWHLYSRVKLHASSYVSECLSANEMLCTCANEQWGKVTDNSDFSSCIRRCKKYPILVMTSTTEKEPDNSSQPS